MTGSTYAILINIAVVLLKEDDPLASPSVEASLLLLWSARGTSLPEAASSFMRVSLFIIVVPAE